MKTFITALTIFSLSASASISTLPQTEARRNYNALIWDGKADAPWFEWWYYKVVLPEQNRSFYMVYGIVNPWDKDQRQVGSSAFVGFGDFEKKINLTDKLRVTDFQAASDATEVKIAGNFATDRALTGAITSKDGTQVSWDMTVEKRWAYNGMGWGMYIPNLTNIGWFPAQADARCSGKINSNGEVLTFTDAPCYQDRNWGTSFPKWWTWIVSNQFKEDKNAAIAIGGGLPDVLGRKVYAGVTVGIRYGAFEYTFRPNDLDNIKTDVSWGKWHVEATDRSGIVKVVVDAWAPESKFMDLQFMTPQGQIFHDLETLTGDMTVTVYRRSASFLSWKVDQILTTNYAGIEYGSH